MKLWIFFLKKKNKIEKKYNKPALAMTNVGILPSAISSLIKCSKALRSILVVFFSDGTDHFLTKKKKGKNKRLERMNNINEDII